MFIHQRRQFSSFDKQFSDKQKQIVSLTFIFNHRLHIFMLNYVTYVVRVRSQKITKLQQCEQHRSYTMYSKLLDRGIVTYWINDNVE